MAKSILQTEKECFLCRHYLGDQIPLTDKGLEEHHIFGGPDRKQSERFGLKVWLCDNHHTGKYGSRMAVHKNDTQMQILHEIGQEAFEKTHTREEFRKIFRKSYL